MRKNLWQTATAFCFAAFLTLGGVASAAADEPTPAESKEEEKAKTASS